MDEHLAASPAGTPLPFFAYVAFHNVHLPLEAPPQYLERYQPGTFDDACEKPPCWDREQIAGMVTAVDDSIGEYLRAVDAAHPQMRDNLSPIDIVFEVKPSESCGNHYRSNDQ